MSRVVHTIDLWERVVDDPDPIDAQEPSEEHDHAWRLVKDHAEPGTSQQYRCDICNLTWSLTGTDGDR